MLSRRRFLLTSAATAPALALTSPYLPAQVPPSAQEPAAFKALKDRSHEAVPISAAERQHRVERARELLAQHKLAALTVAGGTTLEYFLGIPAGQSERLFAWTLPATGNPFIVCPTFEEGRVHEALSTSPNGASTPQVIRENQIVLIDDSCFVHGYQSDISRTFVYGNPTDRQKRVFDIVHRAQSAALAANMTFSDDPEPFGIRLEDDMHITEDGAKLFTPQSPSL